MAFIILIQFRGTGFILPGWASLDFIISRLAGKQGERHQVFTP